MKQDQQNPPQGLIRISSLIGIALGVLCLVWLSTHLINPQKDHSLEQVLTQLDSLESNAVSLPQSQESPLLFQQGKELLQLQQLNPMRVRLDLPQQTLTFGEGIQARSIRFVSPNTGSFYQLEPAEVLGFESILATEFDELVFPSMLTYGQIVDGGIKDKKISETASERAKIQLILNQLGLAEHDDLLRLIQDRRTPAYHEVVLNALIHVALANNHQLYISQSQILSSKQIHMLPTGPERTFVWSHTPLWSSVRESLSVEARKEPSSPVSPFLPILTLLMIGCLGVVLFADRKQRISSQSTRETLTKEMDLPKGEDRSSETNQKQTQKNGRHHGNPSLSTEKHLANPVATQKLSEKQDGLHIIQKNLEEKLSEVFAELDKNKQESHAFAEKKAREHARQLKSLVEKEEKRFRQLEKEKDQVLRERDTIRKENERLQEENHRLLDQEILFKTQLRKVWEIFQRRKAKDIFSGLKERLELIFDSLMELKASEKALFRSNLEKLEEPHQQFLRIQSLGQPVQATLDGFVTYMDTYHQAEMGNDWAAVKAKLTAFEEFESYLQAPIHESLNRMQLIAQKFLHEECHGKEMLVELQGLVNVFRYLPANKRHLDKIFHNARTLNQHERQLRSAVDKLNKSKNGDRQKAFISLVAEVFDLLTRLSVYEDAHLSAWKLDQQVMLPLLTSLVYRKIREAISKPAGEGIDELDWVLKVFIPELNHDFASQGIAIKQEDVRKFGEMIDVYKDVLRLKGKNDQDNAYIHAMYQRHGHLLNDLNNRTTDHLSPEERSQFFTELFHLGIHAIDYLRIRSLPSVELHEERLNFNLIRKGLQIADLEKDSYKVFSHRQDIPRASRIIVNLAREVQVNSFQDVLVAGVSIPQRELAAHTS